MFGDTRKLPERLKPKRSSAVCFILPHRLIWLQRLGESIRCPKFPLCVTAAGVLKQQTLDANVGYLAGNSFRVCTLRQYLAALKHPL